MSDKFVPPEPPHNRKGDVEEAWNRMPLWLRVVLVVVMIAVAGFAIWQARK